MSSVNSISVNESKGISFLNIENESASAKISLFGGHVLSYIPKSDSKERLWVSPHAYLNGERAIRGGIPVCWPWFSDSHGKEKGALPSHGFLRTQVWKLEHCEETASSTTVALLPAFTRAEGFEYDCTVKLIIHVSSSLAVSLVTQNTGIVPFSYNCALHTYFQVEHIESTRLNGLYGEYKDKVDGMAVKVSPSPYLITGETDRIHLNAIESVSIEVDESTFTEVQSKGNDSLVVWNPWQSAASISDMDPFGYKHMLCVETSLTQGKTLAPGESHTLVQTVLPPSK